MSDFYIFIDFFAVWYYNYGTFKKEVYMTENFFKADISDIRLSAGIFDEAFSMKADSNYKWSLAKLKEIHQHSTYEIFFVIDGALSIVTENDTLVCRRSVAIIPPFINHYTVPDGLDGHCMYFTLERLPRSESGIFDLVCNAIKDNVTLLPITDDESFYITHIAQAISGRLFRDSTEHFVPLLFGEIFRRLLPENTPIGEKMQKSGKYINTIDTYICAHYCENITLADIAAELYLCEKQISRIIRKEYGCSLSDIVNRRRLAAASMLLKYTTMPISEVAANVGYDYENYFFTLFKKTYGTTPLKYRENAAKGGMLLSSHKE